MVQYSNPKNVENKTQQKCDNQWLCSGITHPSFSLIAIYLNTESTTSHENQSDVYKRGVCSLSVHKCIPYA